MMHCHTSLKYGNTSVDQDVRNKQGSKSIFICTMVRTAVTTKMAAFWHLIYCSLLEAYRHFRAVCCSRLPGSVSTLLQDQQCKLLHMFSLMKPPHCAAIFTWHPPSVGTTFLVYTSVSQPLGCSPVPGPGMNYTGPREILLELITNLNVILYLSTCHTIHIIVLILFMIMP